MEVKWKFFKYKNSLSAVTAPDMIRSEFKYILQYFSNKKNWIYIYYKNMTVVIRTSRKMMFHFVSYIHFKLFSQRIHIVFCYFLSVYGSNS